VGKWGEHFRLLRRMNVLVTLVVAALLTIGVFFVYSACYFSQDQAIRELYKKQIAWVVIGLGCYVGLAVFDYRSLRRSAWWLYGAGLLLLAMVLVPGVGTKIYGARRWLMMFGIGLQPSEIAKVATVLVLARRLSRPGVNLGHCKPLLAALAVAVAPMALILKQPDLGTAMVFVPIVLGMIFVAGVPLKPLVVMGVVGLVAVAVVLGALFLPEKLGMDEEAHDQFMSRLGISPYQKERLEVSLRSDVDPLGAGWNKRQSEIAVGSGGAWGKGFLAGTQNILGFLPHSVARTDFIYSVIAEETGFFGSAVVVALFGVLITFGVLVALMSHDKFGRLVCMGLVMMMFSHVFVNIAMTVGILPITGLPLPLLSYGGTFMVVMMSALGILQSVYIRSRHVNVVFEQVALWRTG